MLTLNSISGLYGLLLPNLGVQELLIILVIAVLIFGGKKIPEIGKGIGEGIRQFKDSLKSEEAKPAEKAEKAETST